MVDEFPAAVFQLHGGMVETAGLFDGLGAVWREHVHRGQKQQIPSLGVRREQYGAEHGAVDAQHGRGGRRGGTSIRTSTPSTVMSALVPPSLSRSLTATSKYCGWLLLPALAAQPIYGFALELYTRGYPYRAV